MAPQRLEERLEQLEERVTILEQLPARVDALALQILQLREEMHADISSTQTSLREEIRAGDQETRRVLRHEINAFRAEVRAEIRNGDKEVMSHARVLHEDLIAKLKLIQEGLGFQS